MPAAHASTWRSARAAAASWPTGRRSRPRRRSRGPSGVAEAKQGVSAKDWDRMQALARRARPNPCRPASPVSAVNRSIMPAYQRLVEHVPGRPHRSLHPGGLVASRRAGRLLAPADPEQAPLLRERRAERHLHGGHRRLRVAENRRGSGQVVGRRHRLPLLTIGKVWRSEAGRSWGKRFSTSDLAPEANHARQERIDTVEVESRQG